MIFVDGSQVKYNDDAINIQPIFKSINTFDRNQIEISSIQNILFNCLIQLNPDIILLEIPAGDSIFRIFFIFNYHLKTIISETIIKQE